MNAIVIDSAMAETANAWRLAFFLGVVLLLAFAEWRVPRRPRTRLTLKRWLHNVSLGVVNSILMRLFVPFSGTAFAVVIHEHGWGLFAQVQLPGWLSIILFVLVFDFVIYCQHRVFHSLRPLWVFHRVHHTDLEYDLTTGNRFHPVSIIVSMVIKLALVAVCGALPVSILIAEILLNVTSMFNHSNIRLGARFDRALRLIIVTPDMHRVHHSVLEAEHGCNFGFNFPWWDRLLGTYLAEPSEPYETMKIGITGFGLDDAVRIDSLLFQPFLKHSPADDLAKEDPDTNRA